MSNEKGNDDNEQDFLGIDTTQQSKLLQRAKTSKSIRPQKM